MKVIFFFFFFFQAEDGIRDGTVTGVQTCALPIYVEPEDMQLKETETETQIKSVQEMPLNTIQNKTLPAADQEVPDRKSTRLNSSHSSISYAVFCLKKKQPPPVMSCDAAYSHTHVY